MRNSFKTIGLWVVLMIGFVAFYNAFRTSGDDVPMETWQFGATDIPA